MKPPYKCHLLKFCCFAFKLRFEWLKCARTHTEAVWLALSVFVLHYISAANYKYQPCTEPHRHILYEIFFVVVSRPWTPSRSITQIYQCNPWNIFCFAYSPRIYLITTGLTLINYYTGISCNWFSWDNQQLGIELSKFSCWLALQIPPPLYFVCVCCKWLLLWGIWETSSTCLRSN